MNHRNLSFEEATRQVADLMAACGQGVSAYEDDPTFQGGNSFEAASAAVEAAEQQADRGHPAPAANEEHFSGLTPAEGLEGLEVPLDHDDEEDLQEALARLQGTQTTVPHQQVEQEEASDDDYGLCATDIDDGDLLPEVIDAEAYSFHNVVECSGNLEAVWKAFEMARRTGEPQRLELPDRSLQMERKHDCWEIRDEQANLWYLEAGENDVLAQQALEAGDLFIWVIPIIEGQDSALVEDLGYIHNGYVFMRR